MLLTQPSLRDFGQLASAQERLARQLQTGCSATTAEQACQRCCQQLAELYVRVAPQLPVELREELRQITCMAKTASVQLAQGRRFTAAHTLKSGGQALREWAHRLVDLD